MKKTFVLTFSFLLIISTIHAQNEFGAVGSYWMYSTPAASGAPSATVMISVEKDTIIDGETYKVLKRNYFGIQILGQPPVQAESSAGLIKISNDSIFQYERLIMDFDMAIGDTIPISEDPFNLVSIVVDSIVTENIDGFDYKKWQGRKICINPNDPYFENEPYTILESVGQVSNDYLFWNTDICNAIDGIFHHFRCYKNGDFTYPPSNNCAPLLISTTQVNDIPGLELFPNPVEDILNINIKDFAIKEVAVFDINGKEILRKTNDTNHIQINTTDLQKGTYLIQIQTKDEMTTRKFVKT